MIQARRVWGRRGTPKSVQKDVEAEERKSTYKLRACRECLHCPGSQAELVRAVLSDGCGLGWGKACFGAGHGPAGKAPNRNKTEPQQREGSGEAEAEGQT